MNPCKWDIKLIENVKTCPLLYDSANALYRSSPAKENAWRNISLEMKLPPEECKRRWALIRYKFVRERLRITSLGSKAIASTRWAAYQHLGFLHKVVKKRRRYSCVNVSQDEGIVENRQQRVTQEMEDSFLSEPDPLTKSENISFAVNDFLPQVDPSSAEIDCNRSTESSGSCSWSPVPNKTVDNMSDAVSRVLKQYIASGQSKTTEENNSVYCFCMSLVDDIKSMDKRSQIKCKIEIMETISRYLTNKDKNRFSNL